LYDINRLINKLMTTFVGEVFGLSHLQGFVMKRFATLVLICLTLVSAYASTGDDHGNAGIDYNRNNLQIFLPFDSNVNLGAGQDGVEIGTVAYTDGSLVLDGSGGMSIPGSESFVSGNFTVDILVYISEPADGAHQRIFTNHWEDAAGNSGVTPCLIINFDSAPLSNHFGKFEFYIRNSSGSASHLVSAQYFEPGWHRLTYRRNGNTVEAWVDEISVGAGTFEGDCTNAYPLTIGTNTNPASSIYNFHGKVNFARFYTEALIDDELFSHGLPLDGTAFTEGFENGFDGHWMQNGDPGNDAAISSSVARTGTYSVEQYADNNIPPYQENSSAILRSFDPVSGARATAWFYMNSYGMGDNSGSWGRGIAAGVTLSEFDQYGLVEVGVNNDGRVRYYVRQGSYTDYVSDVHLSLNTWYQYDIQLVDGVLQISVFDEFGTPVIETEQLDTGWDFDISNIMLHNFCLAPPDVNHFDDVTVQAINDFQSTELQLSFPTVSDFSGYLVEICVTADGLADFPLAGFEHTFSFDTSVLSLVSVQSTLLSGFQYHVIGNTCFVAWEDVTQPLTADQTTTLYTVTFDIIGSPGDVAALTWLADDCENADEFGTVFDAVAYTDGSLTVRTSADLGIAVTTPTSTLPVPDATVSVDNGTIITGVTDAAGEVIFTELPFVNTAVTVSKMEADHNGVDVVDLVKMLLHLVRFEEFDSPFEWIAADVNGDDRVSIVDAILIHRYLAMLDVLPSGDWKFYNSDTVFDLTNWNTAPQYREYLPLDHDQFDQGFYAVRMGDVDESWDPNPAPIVSPEDLGGGELPLFTLSSETVHRDEVASVSPSFRTHSKISGLEIHIRYPESLEFLEVMSAHKDEMRVNVKDGMVHIVWVNVDQPISNLDDFMQLKFFAPEGMTDSPINIEKVVLADDSGQRVPLVTADGSVSVSNDRRARLTEAGIVDDFELYDAYPNPFNPTTTLQFDVKETSKVQVAVYNIMGKKVATLIDSELANGRYQVTVDASTWSSGTYFVTMQASGTHHVRRMILIK
jgi:hypothetical protein